MELFSEETIIDTLIIGSMVAGFIGLLFAGHWQEIRMMRQSAEQIEEVNRTATNYARKQAQMATAANTIRKGHE